MLKKTDWMKAAQKPAPEAFILTSYNPERTSSSPNSCLRVMLKACNQFQFYQF